MAIPNYLNKYFWDIDPRKGNPRLYPDFYIKRILELGDNKAMNWVLTTYGKEKIMKVLLRSSISAKSKNYWELKLKNV